MPSRRTILAAATAATSTALAGCSLTGEGGSDDGNVRTCSSSAEDRDDSSDLIQSADAQPGETVVFRIVLDHDSPDFEALGSLSLLTAAGEAYFLPRENSPNSDSPRRIYEQALGEFPQNGRIEVVANGEDGESLDSLTVEFSCHRTTPPQGN